MEAETKTDIQIEIRDLTTKLKMYRHRAQSGCDGKAWTHTCCLFYFQLLVPSAAAISLRCSLRLALDNKHNGSGQRSSPSRRPQAHTAMSSVAGFRA